MLRFKRFIANLLNLKASDLPKPPAHKPVDTLDPSIQALIQQQVSSQVREAIQNQLLPELQKLLNDQIVPQLEQTIREKIDLNIRPVDITSEQDIVGLETLEMAEETSPEMVKQDTETAKPFSTEEDLESEIQLIEPEEIESIPEVTLYPGFVSRPVDSEKIRIGIDFGTSTTAVSIKIGDERPVPALIGRNRQPYMPSIAYIRPGAEDLLSRAIVGEEAENLGSPNEVLRSVKRCLGCKSSGCSDTGKVLFPWCQGDGSIEIGRGETINPSVVVYLVIKEALQRAIEFARTEWELDLTSQNICLFPTNLGCSAKFNLEQRQIMQQVAHDLGFRQVTLGNIVEEPILAGFTYARFAENPYGRALIFDFGGGTFDTAILDFDRTDEGLLRVTVVSSDGDSWLGGDDIDTLIYNHFIGAIAETLGKSSQNIEEFLNSMERSRLRQLARLAKEQLSSNETFSDVLPTDNLKILSLDLTREELESLLQDSKFIDRSLEAVLRACKLAYAFELAENSDLLDYSAVFKYKLEEAAPQIDYVILVGGVTKIPFLRSKLEALFGSEKLVSEQVVEPISAVAVGGAYPREPQHFSISVPPFGFLLEYQESVTGITKRQELLPPYEYYNFHERYTFNACPAYIHRFSVPEDYLNARLLCKKAEDPEWNLFCTLGHIRSGEWEIRIAIDGMVSIRELGKAQIDLSIYPIIHPIQRRIDFAKKERIRKRREEEIEKTSGKTITIFTEN